ncbi:3-phosphoshikimate 1-carboxyvinyltransferase [Candidatus Gracilibacteria bacterium]|nr:3-phosphoshikimate 1-carboxyvinyltransferase [Candidatus Gracilibacteria bacterium]
MIEVSLPPSKSLSLRAIVLNYLSGEKTVIENLAHCDDVKYLKGAFDVLKNTPQSSFSREKEFFVGEGGAVARFLAVLSLVQKQPFMLHGSSRLHERPMKDLFDALKSLGVKIEYLGKLGFLPIRFQSSNSKSVSSNSIQISGKISSQFVSALLLVAPALPKGLEIELTDTLVSRPYVEMTLEMLHLWGVRYKVSSNFKIFTVFPGFNPPSKFTIPVDCTAASYPIAYSLLSRKSIKILNYGEKIMQGDEAFLGIAHKFGAKILRSAECVEVHPPQKLKRLESVSFECIPDTAMAAMGIAVFADGISEFTGIQTLRVKESDRIRAMSEGLRALGIKVEVEADIMRIYGNPKFQIKNSKLKINSYNDHRIAMVFGVIEKALALNFGISNPECVSKSWVHFWLELADWAGELRKVSAVILKREVPLLTPPPKGEENSPSLREGVRERDNAWTKKQKFSDQILERVRGLRKNQTDAEGLLWALLRNKNMEGLKFRRQHSIGKYIVDFYCHEAGLVIELDGGGHVEKKQEMYDKKRDEFLKSHKLKILRIWNNDVFQNLEGVVDEILASIDVPLLTPPLKGEENSPSLREGVRGRDIQYLIVKKPRRNYAWQFPQGGVEKGESGIQAAKRELGEECGNSLKVSFQKTPRGEYKYFFPEDFPRYFEGIKGAHVTFFQANLLKGEIELDTNELETFFWVTKEQLPKYFYKDYWEVVRKFL